MARFCLAIANRNLWFGWWNRCLGAGMGTLASADVPSPDLTSKGSVLAFCVFSNHLVYYHDGIGHRKRWEHLASNGFPCCGKYFLLHNGCAAGSRTLHHTLARAGFSLSYSLTAKSIDNNQSMTIYSPTRIYAQPGAYEITLRPNNSLERTRQAMTCPLRPIPERLAPSKVGRGF